MPLPKCSVTLLCRAEESLSEYSLGLSCGACSGQYLLAHCLPWIYISAICRQRPLTEQVLFFPFKSLLGT
jgi:hypothetical protein